MYRRSLTALALAIGLALVVAAAPTTTASSHREAPLSATDPQNDGTDLYGLYATNRGARPLILVATGVCHFTPQWRSSRSL